MKSMVGFLETHNKGVKNMGINLEIFKSELASVQSAEEKLDVFAQLSETGLNPKDYRADQHDYMPFLLQIAIDGELDNFLQTVNGHYNLVASVFRVLHPSYLEDLVVKYRRAYGIQRAKIETKMVAIGYIARNTTDQQQDAMINAFVEYDKGRIQAVEAERAKQQKLVG